MKISVPRKSTRIEVQALRSVETDTDDLETVTEIFEYVTDRSDVLPGTLFGLKNAASSDASRFFFTKYYRQCRV